MFWLEPRAPYSDALYEKLAAWSADLERRLRSMVGSAVRHEKRAIPRLVWQTWRTNQLPPALFAERERMMAENPGWTFRLVVDAVSGLVPCCCCCCCCCCRSRPE